MTSAQLLARFKLLAQRPSTDEAWSDANIYLLLEEAQRQINHELALHVPWMNYTAPTLMSTGDSGATYTVGSASTVVVGAMEVYPSSRVTEPLIPGPLWDANADYTMEGPRTIRMLPGARTFPSGPYARYVPETAALDGSNEPTLNPSSAHICIVYRALQEYAAAGGFRDPGYWAEREQKVLWGDPAQAGSVGIIPMLKQQHRTQGGGPSRLWWARFRAPQG